MPKAKELPSDTEFRLMVLVDVERSGRQVAQLYKRATGKEIPNGTIYTAFRRLQERDWVTVRCYEGEDGRVRWYEITPSGKQALGRVRKRYRSLARFAQRTS